MNWSPVKNQSNRQTMAWPPFHRCKYVDGYSQEIQLPNKSSDGVNNYLRDDKRLSDLLPTLLHGLRNGLRSRT